MSFVRPMVGGLIVCEEFRPHDNDDFDLLRCFDSWRVSQFPARAEPFCVVGWLTGGAGEANFVLHVRHYGSREIDLHEIRGRFQFPQRPMRLRFLCRVNHLVLPAAGVYDFSLWIEGQWLAQCACRARLTGDG